MNLLFRGKNKNKKRTPEIINVIAMKWNDLDSQCSAAAQRFTYNGNSVGPDHTAPQEQYDLSLHCLLRPVCPIITVFESRTHQ